MWSQGTGMVIGTWTMDTPMHLHNKKILKRYQIVDNSESVSPVSWIKKNQTLELNRF